MSRPLDLRRASGLLPMLTTVLFVLWSGAYVAVVTAEDNSSSDCSTFVICAH